MMRTVFHIIISLVGLTSAVVEAAAQTSPKPLALSQQTATISGTVVSNDGMPLSAVLVVNSTDSISASALTTASGSTGSFQLSGVPAGNYQICVTVQSGAFIDPCLWNTSGATIALAASQSLAGQVITVQQAAILHVRINDPQSLINIPQSNGAPRGILMGVFALGSRFYSLLPMSTDSNGFDEQIAIPGGTSVPFTIMPLGLSLTDSSGNAVPPSGASIAISVPLSSLSTPIVLTYNVTAGF